MENELLYALFMRRERNSSISSEEVYTAALIAAELICADYDHVLGLTALREGDNEDEKHAMAASIFAKFDREEILK